MAGKKITSLDADNTPQLTDTVVYHNGVSAVRTTWQKISDLIGGGGGGGGGVWGAITGTLTDQTDLVTALGLKEDTANKNASGGYVGLSGYSIQFKNAANTYTSLFANTNTAARTYTFQDRNGTIADDTDLANLTLALSKLTAAVASNTIDNVAYAQEWQWNSLASGSGFKLSAATTAAASSTQKLFEVALSGANATSAQTTYTGYFTNTHTGTTSVNVALYASASGGASNYAALFPNGSVGIGVDPTNAKLELLSTTEILRMQYNSTNYTSFTPTSIGSLAIQMEGTNPIFSVRAKYSATNYSTLEFSSPSGSGVAGLLNFKSTNNTGGIIQSFNMPIYIACNYLSIQSTSNNPSQIFEVKSLNATNHTSGTFKNAAFTVSNFNPASGAVPMYNVIIDGTINQTGSASGITRSLYINQTLTAAADYRAIDIAVGKSIFGGAGAITPAAQLHIVSTTEQLRIGYNATNYFKTTIDGSAITTLDLVAASGTPYFDFAKDIHLGTVGKGLYIKEGTDATMGRATLIGGTIVVLTSKVTANSEIFITSNVDGGTNGFVRVSARTAGTSFTITSSSATDTSTVSWLIVEPA